MTRTDAGKAFVDRMVADGLLEIRPIEEFENSLKVLLRLARRQHQRVPPSKDGVAAVRPPALLPPPDAA